MSSPFSPKDFKETWSGNEFRLETGSRSGPPPCDTSEEGLVTADTLFGPA